MDRSDGLLVKKLECTTYYGQRQTRDIFAWEIGDPYQTFQVLAILSTQAAVCLPYPVPAWRMSVASSKEDNRIVGLDCDVGLRMVCCGVGEVRTIEIQIR